MKRCKDSWTRKEPYDVKGMKKWKRKRNGLFFPFFLNSPIFVPNYFNTLKFKKRDSIPAFSVDWKLGKDYYFLFLLPVT